MALKTWIKTAALLAGCLPLVESLANTRHRDKAPFDAAAPSTLPPLEQGNFNAGLRSLGERFADLALCVPDNAHNGQLTSTLEWYVGNTLAGWSDGVRAAFDDSTQLGLNPSHLIEGFQAALKLRLGQQALPKELSDLGPQLALLAEEAVEASRQGKHVYEGSIRVLTHTNRDSLLELRRLLSSYYKILDGLDPNCEQRKKGAAFYKTPQFKLRPDSGAPVYTARPVPEPTSNPTAAPAPAPHGQIAAMVLVEPPEAQQTRLNSKTKNLLEIAFNEAAKTRSSSRKDRKRRKDIRDSKGLCAMYVSIVLQQAGCIVGYPPKEYRAPGASAKNMGNLTQHGFQNIFKNGKLPAGMKSLKDLPLGAVIVYKGGRHGHVEIKTKDGYISDYFSKNARTGKQHGLSGRSRQVTGIYVKPTCGAGLVPKGVAHAKI